MTKKLKKLLKGYSSVVFLDFEGTQFTHEMIAIGALHVSLDGLKNIKKRKEPFKLYVKATNNIGNYITELTGITQDILNKQGVTFYTAMQELKKYVGRNFKRSVFITFGNHDLKILNETISHNLSYPKEITSTIQKNYGDFAAFMNQFVKDSKGCALSLIHACEHFNAKIEGPSHDPSIDAINLANLYQAFLDNKELLANDYKNALANSIRQNEVIYEVINRLNKGETITPETYESIIKECLK